MAEEDQSPTSFKRAITGILSGMFSYVRTDFVYDRDRFNEFFYTRQLRNPLLDDIPFVQRMGKHHSPWLDDALAYLQSSGAVVRKYGGCNAIDIFTVRMTQRMREDKKKPELEDLARDFAEEFST